MSFLGRKNIFVFNADSNSWNLINSGPLSAVMDFTYFLMCPSSSMTALFTSSAHLLFWNFLLITIPVLLSAIASAAKLFFPECDPSPSPSTFSHLLQVIFGLYFSSCSVTLTSFSAEPEAFALTWTCNRYGASPSIYHALSSHKSFHAKHKNFLQSLSWGRVTLFIILDRLSGITLIKHSWQRSLSNFYFSRWTS